MVSALDDSLLAVVDAFKNKGMWAHTLMVFTTDNGGNLGGSGINYPLRGGKYTFWQGGVRGIGVVGGGLLPDQLRGSSWRGAMHQADFYATIAALAGIDDPSDGTGPLPVDGVNVWPALSTNGTSPREEVPLQIMSKTKGNRYELPPAEWCAAVKGRSEAEHCTPPESNAAETSLGEDASQLQLGMLIQGKWKLLWGYPGWRQNWDGWLKPPAAHDEMGGGRLESGEDADLQTPYKGTLCVARPCLHDIESDPFEHDDVADANPDVVAAMKKRVLALLASEVTLADSGLCPTSYGSKADPRGTAVAVATGFWQPWLNP